MEQTNTIVLSSWKVINGLQTHVCCMSILCPIGMIVARKHIHVIEVKRKQHQKKSQFKCCDLKAYTVKNNNNNNNNKNPNSSASTSPSSGFG